MSLKQDIKNNLNLCLKEKKVLDVSVLRQLLAAVLNKEKEKQFQNKGKEIELSDEEIIETIASEAKKRREAVEAFDKGNRHDLAEKERKELRILEKYLPEQLSKEKIAALAKETIEKTGSRDMSNMGKVMSELMPRLKGRADGVLVSNIVKELLKNQ